ncbi:MAG: hypothetical protein WBF14_10610 [Candidatus Acidiferrales bacterium]
MTVYFLVTIIKATNTPQSAMIACGVSRAVHYPEAFLSLSPDKKLVASRIPAQPAAPSHLKRRPIGADESSAVPFFAPRAPARASDAVIVQYVGFEAKPLVREYSFLVRQSSLEPRPFTIVIVNEAFKSRRVSFQDAPDICSAKLRRELAAFANNPEKTHYRISELELDEYRAAHPSKATHGFQPKPS